MSERVERLASKIVQIVNMPNSTYYSAWLLCEDGSLWAKANTASPIFERVHPPHEPPTQSADLAEALAVLRMLAEYACIDHGKNQSECLKAFDRAWEVLRKNGV